MSDILSTRLRTDPEFVARVHVVRQRLRVSGRGMTAAEHDVLAVAIVRDLYPDDDWLALAAARRAEIERLMNTAEPVNIAQLGDTHA